MTVLSELMFAGYVATGDWAPLLNIVVTLVLGLALVRQRLPVPAQPALAPAD